MCCWGTGRNTSIQTMLCRASYSRLLTDTSRPTTTSPAASSGPPTAPIAPIPSPTFTTVLPMNQQDADDSSGIAQLVAKYNQQTQILLDRAAPLIPVRWAVWVVTLLAYAVRVWLLKGFYIVTYGLGIFNLNLLLGFITPQVDPELEQDGPALPTKSDQEFKPFVRRLPEFKFWWSSIKSIWIGLGMTLFPMFDVPVFWPILLLYWLLLFTVTMKRQIKHMIKYRYLPFNTGKKKYGEGRKEAAK